MLKKILKVLKWIGIVILVGFVIVVIIRVFHFYNLDKTNVEVAKIHSTKLQMADVLGTNLPPDPGAQADATVQGIDVNKNGIRDDVELAIFKEYPNSVKTRAVLLQYALALQMEVTQPIVNEETVIAVTQEEDRAYVCIGDIFSREDLDKFSVETEILNKFVEEKQFNTVDRKNYRTEFYKNIGSYKSLDRVCDIDYSSLPN
ncbi:hypothetical protein IT400_02610 [Candidatus Nomurabacteria bacterium]|nr:hypothetical protein [Candidatus Nomurabacteria bacterium]